MQKFSAEVVVGRDANGRFEVVAVFVDRRAVVSDGLDRFGAVFFEVDAHGTDIAARERDARARSTCRWTLRLTRDGMFGVMNFRCGNIFNCDADTFWTKLFFDREYNEGLYKGALGFENFELLEVTGEPGGDRTRKILTEPKTEAPAVVQKLIGGGVTYTEAGRLDAKTGKFDYAIVTSKLSDKVTIKGQLWVEPCGVKKVERICDVELHVSIFGVGGALEKFIAETTRASYEKTTRYTNEFIAKKGY